MQVYAWERAVRYRAEPLFLPPEAHPEEFARLNEALKLWEGVNERIGLPPSYPQDQRLRTEEGSQDKIWLRPRRQSKFHRLFYEGARQAGDHETDAAQERGSKVVGLEVIAAKKALEVSFNSGLRSRLEESASEDVADGGGGVDEDLASESECGDQVLPAPVTAQSGGRSGSNRGTRRCEDDRSEERGAPMAPKRKVSRSASASPQEQSQHVDHSYKGKKKKHKHGDHRLA